MIGNYRISRARRIVENVFGIATSRFRLFRRAITAGIDVAVEATKSIVALHNYLMAERCFFRNPYCPPDYIDLELNGSVRQGGWRSENASFGIRFCWPRTMKLACKMTHNVGMTKLKTR